MPTRIKSDDRPSKQLTPTLKTPSEYEESLLKFFALHRIATAYNIMDTYPSWFEYHNKTMRHLNWLANQGYLRRHDHGDCYVFNITDTGYLRCRDIPSMDLNTIPYHYQEPTGTQANHELLITRTAIGIYQYIRQSPHVRLLSEGRFMLRQLPWVDQDTGEETYPFEHLVPDYWYMIRDQNGFMVRFLEVIAGEESPTRVRGKLREYQLWGQQRHVQQFLQSQYARFGAREPRPEFQVHCILESRSWRHTDAWKERMTMMQTFQVDPLMQGRVWTTTKEALETALAEGLSINHAIWHRGKDFLGKRTDWQRARPGTRSRLVDSYMRHIPAYPLFA